MTNYSPNADGHFHERVLNFATQLETWFRPKAESLFGRLSTHLSQQLGKARKELASTTGRIDVEIPLESERASMRKKYHSRLAKGLWRHTYLAAILACLGFIKGLIDQIGDRFGYATYVAVGIGIVLVTFITVLTLRSHFGKAVWPASRIFKYIVLSIFLGFLVAVWPAVSLGLGRVLDLVWWPSWWLILVVAVVSFALLFFVATLAYFSNWQEHWNTIDDIVARLERESQGTQKLRGDIKRLELMKAQVEEWAAIYGENLQKPWGEVELVGASKDLSEDLDKFPPSLRVAKVLEKTPSGGQVLEISRLVSALSREVTPSGWRSKALEDLIVKAHDFSSSDIPLSWERLDSDSPAASNGSRRELLEAVSNDDVLSAIANERLEQLLPVAHEAILGNGQLRVVMLGEKVDDFVELPWDEHLKSGIGDLTLGPPSLAPFGIAEHALADAPASAVNSFVVAPKRLVDTINSQGGSNGIGGTELIPVRTSGDQSVDLVLRLDVAGLTSSIPVTSLKAFSSATAAGAKGSKPVKTYCPECGLASCPRSKDADAACSSTHSGI